MLEWGSNLFACRPASTEIRSSASAWIQNVKHTLQLHPSGCDLRGRGGSLLGSEQGTLSKSNSSEPGEAFASLWASLGSCQRWQRQRGREKHVFPSSLVPCSSSGAAPRAAGELSFCLRSTATSQIAVMQLQSCAWRICWLCDLSARLQQLLPARCKQCNSKCTSVHALCETSL